MKGGFQIILFLIQRSFQNKIHAITSLLITFPNELQRKETCVLVYSYLLTTSIYYSTFVLSTHVCLVMTL